MVPPEELGTRRTCGAPSRPVTRKRRPAFPRAAPRSLPRLRLRRIVAHRLSISRGCVRLVDESPAHRWSTWQTGDANGNDHRRFGRAASAGTGAWTLRHAGNRVAGRDVDCAAAFFLQAGWVWVCRRRAALVPRSFCWRLDRLLADDKVVRRTVRHLS